MASLEKELQKCKPDKIKLIVVDGVFSMEGDVANLPEIVRLAKQYDANIMRSLRDNPGIQLTALFIFSIGAFPSNCCRVD